MADNKPLEILKGALLLERKGRAFYEHAAQQIQEPMVKKVFEMMAKEEKSHVEILTRQYTNLVRDGKLREIHYDTQPLEILGKILTAEVKNEISAAGFEAAAVSAAIGMEDRAVRYYSEQVGKAVDTIEKELFTWLANWEKGHLKMLMALD
ncbi:ferritin family protein, partial [candidate division KSB1 bacterium]|nr:ferritin family protein [candidate division KSB1 bacterium]